MTKLEDWIDYMEGEADLKKMAKLGLLVEHSERDREILTNLMRVREHIRLADPANAIEDQISKPSFLKNLHREILSAVQSEKLRPLNESSKENSSTRD